MAQDTPQGTFAALKSRNFRVYFLGYLPSVAGNFMQNAALSWVIYQQTGSNEDVSLVMACLLIPTIFLMLPAGAVADRLDRRKILVLTQAVGLIQALCVWFLALSGALSVSWAAALCAVGGCCLAFEIPARVPLVCASVDSQRIPNALALNSLVFHGGLTVGRALAAIALSIGYVTSSFFVNALSFAIELVSLAMMKGSFKAATPQPSKTISDITAAFRMLWGDDVSRRIIILVAVFGFFGMQFQPLIAGLASTVPGSAATVMALLLTAIGVGQTVGSLALARKANKDYIKENLWLAYLLLGFATLLLAAASSLTLLVVAALLLGICIPPCVSGGNAVLQARTADAWRGRATSIYFTVFFGVEPAGYLLAGWFADRFGVAAALAIAASACLLAAVWYRVTYRQPIPMRAQSTNNTEFHIKTGSARRALLFMRKTGI